MNVKYGEIDKWKNREIKRRKILPPLFYPSSYRQHHNVGNSWDQCPCPGCPASYTCSRRWHTMPGSPTQIIVLYESIENCNSTYKVN